MNVALFQSVFETFFPRHEQDRPSPHFEDAFSRSFFDPCFDVPGMASLKKLKLLNIAVSLLPENEAYLEVGTYVGKSLISALLGNPGRLAYACDNFSEFTESNSLEHLVTHLRRYDLYDKVRLFDADFRQALSREHIDAPVGVYFNDGPHDEESQYLGIKLGEPLLADEALVLVDDWRLANDSGSYAKAGTERAISESRHRWTRLYELPARFNGDQGLWWNGVGVYAFQRQA